jgi:hypothetical protein
MIHLQALAEFVTAFVRYFGGKVNLHGQAGIPKADARVCKFRE